MTEKISRNGNLSEALASHVRLDEAKQAPRVMVPPKHSAEVTSHLKQAWNTKNLGLRLAADGASALCAASLVAPLISIIDRSIMENASGRRPSIAAALSSALTGLLRRPHTFLVSRPVGLILLVYGGTYATANALDTASATLANRPADAVTSGTAKFAASSAANVGLCVYKDQAYARLYGPPAAASAAAAIRPVGLPSYALFALRDGLTIFASFNVPPRLGPYLQRTWLDGGGAGAGATAAAAAAAALGAHVSGQTLAQFAAPAAVQVLSTPLHLLGLDLYNRPGPGQPWAERWRAVRRNWAPSVAARICRIVPAFGVGGTVNFKVRKSLMEKLA